jgi:hypothetical protein
MQAPDSKRHAKVTGVPPLSAEVPEDVLAELELHSLPPQTPASGPLPPAEPIPEDVLAEQDAAVRAAQAASADPDLRPVALDDDSEY